MQKEVEVEEEEGFQTEEPEMSRLPLPQMAGLRQGEEAEAEEQ